jgi:hypothetical protein
MMGRERGYSPEMSEAFERTLIGEERERFIADQRAYVEGLEASLADPDLDEETRGELQEQLEGLKESLAEAEAGGAIMRAKE